MPFKPNYNQQRNARTRAKEQKQQEKLKRREDKAAARRNSQEEPPAPSDVTEGATTRPANS
jgi:hypothetical protein